jgi:hypothetical protein
MTNLPPPISKGSKRTVKGGAFNFSDFPNPLPQEIADVDELKNLHRRYNLVPYAGSVDSSGDSLRRFLKSMSYLSPTHGSCIESKKRFAFGKMIAVNIQDGDFFIEDLPEVTAQQAREFFEFLQSINTDKNFKLMACDLYRNWEESGDQWLEIQWSESMGETTYSIFHHKPERVKYIATEKGEQRFAAISPIWTDHFLSKYPPDIIPVYPGVLETEDGVSKTLLHRRNGGDWYGRPPAFPSWIYQYREFQDSSYLTKIAGNNFTGQVIIEAEDDNPAATDEAAREAGFENEAHRIEENFSSKSDDPMTVWYTTRPYGAKEMFVHQVRPNTSHEFYEAVGAIAEKKIIRAHSWSKLLMDDSESKSGLSTNLFMDVLKSKLPIINEVQENGVSILNHAIQIINELSGAGFEGIGLDFRSPYQEIMEQSNDDNNSSGSDPVQSGRE